MCYKHCITVVCEFLLLGTTISDACDPRILKEFNLAWVWVEFSKGWDFADRIWFSFASYMIVERRCCVLDFMVEVISRKAVEMSRIFFVWRSREISSVSSDRKSSWFVVRFNFSISNLVIVVPVVVGFPVDKIRERAAYTWGTWLWGEKFANWAAGILSTILLYDVRSVNLSLDKIRTIFNFFILFYFFLGG